MKVLSRNFRRALVFVAPYWRRLAFLALLSAVNTALSLTLPLLSKSLVDRALIGRDTNWLYLMVALFAASAVTGYLLTAVTGLQYTAVSADVLFDMRLVLYRHLHRLSPRFYAERPLGDILSRVNNDVGDIQRVASESLFSWVGNALYLIGSVAAMCWLDLRLTLVGAVVMPFAIWALVRTRGTLGRHIQRVRETSAQIGSFLIETLQAIRLVVISNAQEREVARFRTRNNEFVRALMSMQLWSYVTGGMPGLILSAGYAIVLVYGGQRVIVGTLSLGTFVGFMAYYMRLFQPVQAMMGLYTSFATVKVSLARVYELLDTRPEVVEPLLPVALDVVAGEVALRNITVDLGRGPILKSISLVATPGQTVAIVGPSGSGKSTIADLLVRLIDPDQGVVSLDGCDLKRLSLLDVRRHVALVDQTPILFHATITENIRYARPHASNDEIVDVARAAGVDEIVARLPQGMDTIVGERGAALSAGERQRVALARALLLNPKVLVLDEPTAALDPAMEQQVWAGYERVMRGRTTILITHNIGLAAAADRVIVLGDKGIIEQGRPEELRSFQGVFAELSEK